MTKYYSVEDVLLGNATKPELLDCIPLVYEDIEVDVYGVLHAITGGTNKEYISLVNKSIAAASGATFCEKSMKLLYVGLDWDVHDWVQIKSKDAFLFSFMSLIKPSFLWVLARTLWREKTTHDSAFGQNGIYSGNDISGAAHFHAIKPSQRRLMAGFPSSEQYAKLNMLRLAGKDKRQLSFIDPDWHWLTYVEPYANLPLRSIHMIEYAVAYAKRHHLTRISLFVGEMHNSDIEWYVTHRINNTLPAFISDKADEVKREATQLVYGGVKSKYTKYMLHLGMGALSAIMLYAAVFLAAYSQF
jgi:hypothetical protein